MSEIELRGLIAVVERETVMLASNVAQFGQTMWDPVTDTYKRLCEELEFRRPKQQEKSRERHASNDRAEVGSAQR